jgi:hypothetical protein
MSKSAFQFFDDICNGEESLVPSCIHKNYNAENLSTINLDESKFRENGGGTFATIS